MRDSLEADLERASGSDEPGELRCVTPFMKRTAVQGYSPLLEKLWG